MEDFYAKFVCEKDNRYSIVIEDDGRVCYAYLLYEDNIIGDVWLYNRNNNPITVDWKDESSMPFLNPIEFLKENTLISPIMDLKDIKITWELKMGNYSKSICYINGCAIAILDTSSTPGWSFLVKKDGPLARVINLTL